jgi:HD-GYP domain-containing protein (c-di-GMP phosphodiesterase class II)
MTTDRVYRKKLPVAEALRRLKEGSGTQFDPQVVEMFLHLVETGLVFGGSPLEEEQLQPQLPWAGDGLLRPA